MRFISKRSIIGLAAGAGMTASLGLGIGALGTANAAPVCVPLGGGNGACVVTDSHPAQVGVYARLGDTTANANLTISCDIDAKARVADDGNTVAKLHLQIGQPCPDRGD